MANANIDPYPEGVTQLPFEDARIPTQKTTLEEPSGKPDAFKGEDETPNGVQDATIESGKVTDVPVTPIKAAEELAGGNLGKAVASGKTQDSAADPAITKPDADNKKSEEDEKQTRRTRKTKDDDSK